MVHRLGQRWLSRVAITVFAASRVIHCAESNSASATISIKIDQVGYLPLAPKIAVVAVSPANSAGIQSFKIVRSLDNHVVFEGKLGPGVSDPDSGDTLRPADFTDLHATGKYYVDVPGVGRSWSFRVAPDVFSNVYYLAMRSYYGQRCGTAVDLGAEFPGYRHSACHLTGAYHESSGRSGAHVSTHGWHDAGDYGRYVVNAGISTGTLLWTWEMYGAGIKNISLHLPESGNGVPDILNEIRWNLDWMMSMQDTDGGVWHKQTSAAFAPFIMPEADALVSYVIGTGERPFKSSCATADFAAVMAIAGRVYRPFDAAFSRNSLLAAQNAWAWLSANPNVTFKNPPGVKTGEYGDPNCGDERLWAAAELSRSVQKREYSEYFFQHYREYLDRIRPVGPQTWSEVAPLALWTYVFGNAKGPEAEEVRKRTLDAANEIADRTNHNAYHVSLTTRDYIWGSNGVAANYGMQLLVADHFQHDQRYTYAAADNLHYILGRNTFSLSWVTQVGEHAFQHPHHRLSAADNLPLPWPGLMSGGPNAGRQDPVMKKLVAPGLPPAKSYVDETGAYACNEIAINWNAPLVFSLAAMLPN